MKLDDFGQVYVYTGASEIGQGSETVIAQVVAEELGVRVEDVNVINNDTAVCPWDVGAHASRTTFVAGNSALGAARQIKRQMLELAGDALEASPDDLVAANGQIYVKGSPEKKIPIGKLLRGAHHRDDGTMLMAEFFYDPSNEMLNKEFKGNMSMAYTFGPHGVEVEVDKETGKVEILRYVSAHDVGKALNPMLLEGQIYGGAMMGIGYALTEQLVLRKGEVQNPTFRDYTMLTAGDVVPMKSFIVETEDEHGPFGAKGIGEPGCVPSAPAIANAIYDAVGVRITDLPITPEKVLAALKGKEGKA